MHSEGNYQQNEKATYWMGEDICKRYIWYGLISKIHKELIQFNIKNKQTNKNEQPGLKVDRGSE